jgi:predicted nucleic acid-binding protein
MMKCFVDTNILLYARDTTSPSKLTTAKEWLRELAARRAIVLSAQSLREYYWNALGSDRSSAALSALRTEIVALDALVPDALRIDWLARAWFLQDRYRLGFWDSLLVASALAVQCTIFLSEDLNSGQKIETLAVVNPFTTRLESLFST